MKFNFKTIIIHSGSGDFKHFLYLSKLLLPVIVLCCMFFPLQVNAQSSKVTIDKKNVTIKTILNDIEAQTSYLFIYNSDINVDRIVSVRVKVTPVSHVLDQIFKLTRVKYTLRGNNIALAYQESIPNEVAAGENDNEITFKARGKILDASGFPVVGATIIQQGTHNGTITDVDGNYSIDVPRGSKLVITYIGFKPIVITAKRNDTAILIEDTHSLNDVVVVGYGTQRRVNLTGSVISIDSKEIIDRKVAQTSLALQGAATGVTVTQRSGQPGFDGGTIRIRGIGTLNNSDPLVLVDGVEMDINLVDATSIESISVLKDAASASIYGSKAANGVILITTKRASQGKFNISYSGYLTKQSATNLPKKVGAIDHMKLLNEAKINSGAGVVYTDEQIQNWETLGTGNRDLYPDTDWQEVLLTGSGIQQNHSITLQGGIDRLRAFASINYLNQKGIIKNVEYEKYSLRLNTDYTFSPNFSTSIDLFAYYDKAQNVAPYSSNSSNGFGIGYVFYLMNKLPAVQAATYSSGQYAEGQNGENPLAFINEGGFSITERTPITARLSFEWDPVKELNIKGVFSPSFSYPRIKNMINTVATYNLDGSVFSTLPAKSQLTERSDYDKNIQTNITATYNKTIKYHQFKVMAGMQYEYVRYSVFTAFRDNILSGFSELRSGSVDNQQSDGYANEYALLSYFGRLNYSFLDRYLFEANIRYDGSSRFAKGNKWGAFPSVSAGWRISEERFWNNLKGIIPNLKFRISWGTLGNQNVSSYYPFASNVELTTTYISNDILKSGGAITVMNNPDITWETTYMTDLGLDFNLFNKLNVTFDWYYKKTNDILMQLEIPGTMGVSPTYQNAGVVRNVGWDLSLSHTDKIGEFRYNVSFNLSDVKNKIIDLKGINGTSLVTNREGYSINSLYMLKSLGILNENDFNMDGTYKHESQYRNLAPGDLRYADLDKSGTVNDLDREVLGSTIPRFTYGFSLYGEYKGIDLNVLIQGVGKVDGYLTGIQNPFYSGGTIYDIHKDRWTTDSPNTNSTFPRLYFGIDDNNYKASDFYLKSAAYLRLKNFQMGYTLPAKVTNKFNVSSLRIYFIAENLFTITGFWNGWDPEVTPGTNGQFYPQVKNIGFGIDLKF